MALDDLAGLAGKSVLIAGGGQGIGEACSLVFAQAGADVAVLDLERDRAEAVAAKVNALGCKGVPVVGSLFDEAEAAFGGIDVLVTVVGSTKFMPIVEMSMEDWDIEQKINIRYVFQIAKHFSASRIAAGEPGAATFVASVSGMTSALRHVTGHTVPVDGGLMAANIVATPPRLKSVRAS